MAQQLSASIYGYNSSSMGTAQGTTMSFPTQLITIRPAPAGTVFNGVTMVTAIQLLPTATKVGADLFFTPTAVATVITAANA